MVAQLSTPDPTIAVTGATGRLGRVVVAELARRGTPAIPWSRPRYDLDDPAAARRVVRSDQPSLVIHAAGWVDVDGCARDPELADRRNAHAAGELARESAAAGADLVLVSSNEVFDGSRSDEQGYDETDRPSPANPYGRSKLAGERAAIDAYADAGARLWIVRTAWLFGPAGDDFPERIVAAADRAPTEPLQVVDDEVGTPTHTGDLASAILELVDVAPPGTYHLVGAQRLSRYEWAADLLGDLRPSKVVEPISGGQFTRASTPPSWGVLATSAARRLGLELRPWRDLRDETIARLR